MKDTIKLVLVLVLICCIAGSLLAWVHKVTINPIQETERKVKNTAVTEVLPGHNNDPLADMVQVADSGRTWNFNVARMEGVFAGAAFENTSSKGYGGDITVMVGIDASDTVTSVKILGQKETPGLGAKVVDPAWRSQFAGKSIAGTRWSVKKDQGDIDQITAATISSRAVTEAVSEGLNVYLRNRAAIAGTEAKETGGEER